MYRNKTAQQHNFAIIPGAHVQRSKFPMRQTRKMGFNASELVPIMCEEVLPGDVWQHNEAVMARLSTPIAPIMDDMDLETWYFFVPNRITWTDHDNNWEDFITGKNTALVVPKIVPNNPAGAGVGNYGVLEGGTVDQFRDTRNPYTTNTACRINALPIWAYFKIYNEWFRDQNLQSEWTYLQTQPAQLSSSIEQDTVKWGQVSLRANKRHDYFTSSLPWAQKGVAVSLPLGTSAPVIPDPAQTYPTFTDDGGTSMGIGIAATITGAVTMQTPPAVTSAIHWSAGAHQTGLVTDLTLATAATINQLRLSVIVQRVLERDARGGSRYVEQLLSIFGVRAKDYRLQRPEYLGGHKIPITVNPIAQTASYEASPGPTDSAVGNLGAEMHASGSSKTFTYAAEEHGYIIGIACVRSTPTYQQGVRRHWQRNTRLDFWQPEFAQLGEQTVGTNEIYIRTDGTPAVPTWGYQERGAEYRYTPNEITGVLRSSSGAPMDWWHLSEEFSGEPALNATFIVDRTQETLDRALATAATDQWSCQIIMDILHSSSVARLMPAYSVPGIKSF